MLTTTRQWRKKRPARRDTRCRHGVIWPPPKHLPPQGGICEIDPEQLTIILSLWLSNAPRYVAPCPAEIGGPERPWSSSSKLALSQRGPDEVQRLLQLQEWRGRWPTMPADRPTASARRQARARWRLRSKSTATKVAAQRDPVAVVERASGALIGPRANLAFPYMPLHKF
jgi:hypothetical protein